jgi:hypothetical protein
MGQDNANPKDGAQNLGELGDAFGSVETKPTTKESRKAGQQQAPAERGTNGRYQARQAASGDDGDDDGHQPGDDEDDDDGHAKPGKQKPEPKDDDDDDGGDQGDAGEGDQGDDGEEGEGEEGDDEGGEQKTTLKVNGKTHTLTHAELLEAASKGISSHERWQKAANTQKQADDLIGAVNQQRAQLNQMLQNVQTHIRAIISSESPDLDALAQTDPAAWVRQKHLMETRQQHLRDAEAASAYLASQQAQLQHIQKGQFLELQKESVLDAIPAWRDPEKAKAAVSRINTLLSDAGFSPQEIEEIGDARIVRVLHKAAIDASKARKYDDLKGKASAANKRVQNLPPVVEKPGNRQPQQNVKAKQRERAVKAWEAKPNLDNLARLF